MVSEILAEADAKMRRALEALQRELATLRTGRAAPALVENIRADYYGVPTPLNQLATITAPDARLILIQPWDRTSLSSIEKAILKSDLGLHPSNDGTFIRLAVPPLSEERRQELVKVVRRRVEEDRIELRNIRRETVEVLRQREKDKLISQDENRRTQEQLQRLLDKFIAEANRIGESKEAELVAT